MKYGSLIIFEQQEGKNIFIKIRLKIIFTVK